ncbi:MAG: glycogen synthase [Elusimicrobia bacterium]|nr:glycogen synthase [Elusimicrobiota bacterium]
MKIVFAASEAVPFIKTGGLGEVVGALSAALARSGHDVRVVIPKYRSLSLSAPAGVAVGTVRIPLGAAEIPVTMEEVALSPRCRAWLVDSPAHFDREGVYVDSEGREFGDNDARFVLLARAVLEFPKTMGFRPDIIHAHDWQTGLVPAYLHLAARHDPFFSKTASVFSIHNIAFQGVFPKETLACARLPWTEFTAEKIEFYDRVNFLKAGLAYAQVLSTVSPTYALETQREEFGVGLDGFLKRRADHYFGILNGIDLRLWNPAQDPHLAQKFSAKSLAGRTVCRADLQRAAGLQEDPRAPLLGMVSRLDSQKGLIFCWTSWSSFFRTDAKLFFSGRGAWCFRGRCGRFSENIRAGCLSLRILTNLWPTKFTAGPTCF